MESGVQEFGVSRALRTATDQAVPPSLNRATSPPSEKLKLRFSHRALLLPGSARLSLMRSSNASVLLATFISIVLGAVNARTPPSAIERFRDLRAHLQQNRKDNDWKAGLENAKALSDFLNGSPLSLMEVARAELQVGHEAEAWAEVERFLAMGQTSKLLTSPMFAGLHADASHPNIPEVMKRNQTAVGIGSTAFILRDAGLVPEDIGYDSATKRFYLGSVLKKKIIVVDDQGNAKDFAEGPNHWPMLALSVDSKRGLLWATEVAPDGFSSVPKADWGRSAVVGYELASGKLRFRIPGPQPSALGDMTLADNGDPIVSDGDGGGVYRVHEGQMERVDGGDFVSPQTPAISGDEKHIFIPDYVRGIGELDPTTKKVKWLSGEGEHALTGVDGSYVANGMLLLCRMVHPPNA